MIQHTQKMILDRMNEISDDLQFEPGNLDKGDVCSSRNQNAARQNFVPTDSFMFKIEDLHQFDER